MTDAPWWGVPMIAGGFLIIGGLLTYIFNYANDRRRRLLEDRRRFEPEIIELYEKLDDAIDGLHNNAGATDEAGLAREAAEYHRLYMQILKAGQRLDIIAPRELASIAEEIRLASIRLGPNYQGEYGNAMADMVESGEYFRIALRRHLRIRDERIPGSSWLSRKVEPRLPERWQIALENRRRSE